MAIIFNGVSFNDPTTMNEVPKIVNKSEWRSINNTLTTDILDFQVKKEFILEWDILSESEFNTLMSYVDIGQIPVSSTMAGHTFSFTLASVSLTNDVNHTWNGHRRNIEIIVRQA